MIEEIRTTVVPLSEYERAFREGAKQGWWGSDCAFSLPLGNGRVLWLFGDTFVHDHGNFKSRHGSSMINNSIAIQTGNLLKDRQPLTFYWQRKNGGHQSFLVDESSPGFLWPLSAAFVQKKIFIFTVRIVHPDPTKTFGFQQTGCEIIRIENPDDTPEQWQMQFRVLPWQQDLGSYCSNFFFENGCLYIYGYLKDSESWFDPLKFVVARVNLRQNSDLLDLKDWEFFDGVTGEWFSDMKKVRAVFNHSTTEFSVTYLPKLNKYILIANFWKYPHSITIRLSDTPVGPFSEPKIIYHCPETEWSRNYFCYAAKAHPELAEGDNDLVITYMTNSKLLQECVDDLRIYYPRFLRIILDF